jgi:SAM-dependent methyltransferase
MDRDSWDRAAETFDDDPDHGLADPATRAAWRELLATTLPPPPARIADLGCGTGTLTGLLTDEGYAVDGVDFSEAMIGRARSKVPKACFVVGDAAHPPLRPGGYDVVLSRHVLWALAEPEAAFARWVSLLRPGGMAVLIEGSWSTGSGLISEQAARIVRTVRSEAEIRHLPEAVYWGREIDDERYLVVSRS